LHGIFTQFFDTRNKRRKPIRWRPARKLAVVALAPLLVGLSIAIVPSGQAGVLLNQFSGARQETLVPGFPSGSARGGIDSAIQCAETRFFSTTLETTKKNEALRVQTQEGLSASLAVAVRYRPDARSFPISTRNLPQPVEEEIVNPAVASVFREINRHYLVREIFSTKARTTRRESAAQITSSWPPMGSS